MPANSLTGRIDAARSVAVALALAGWLAAPGCSLITDFDNASDAGLSDADPNNVADALPAALCTNLEPNDSLSLPFLVNQPGTLTDIAVCPPGDHDFYRFTLGPAQDLVITVEFRQAAQSQDLDLRLYNDVDTNIAISASFDANESLSFRLASGNQLAEGSYTAEVYSPDDTGQNDYTLTIDITNSARRGR